MILTETSQVHMTCPRCYRLVHLTAVPVTDETGHLAVEMDPLWHAMSLHMRGCTGE